jgi:hypothetical protein
MLYVPLPLCGCDGKNGSFDLIFSLKLLIICLLFMDGWVIGSSSYVLSRISALKGIVIKNQVPAGGACFTYRMSSRCIGTFRFNESLLRV